MSIIFPSQFNGFGVPSLNSVYVMNKKLWEEQVGVAMMNIKDKDNNKQQLIKRESKYSIER